MGVARSQECGDELACICVEDQERVVDMLLVVAVVVTLFLIAVGGIVCGIEVEQDLLWGTILATLGDIHLGQSPRHLVAGTATNRILHPANGGLARQILATLRQGSTYQLQQRIRAQEVRIVLVLVATSYLKDTLF
jgi:hypothetical protein